MEGYEVITSDDEKVGHVVGTAGNNLIVEHGHVLKSKHAVPRTFASVDEAEGVVRVTVSKAILEDSPKIKNGDVDEQAIAEHYGLAEAFEEPETEGYGDLLPDDPARTAEDDARRAGVPTAPEQRAAIREGMSGTGEPQPESPALLGDRHDSWDTKPTTGQGV